PGLMATLACKLHYMNSRNTAGLFAPMRLKLALDNFKLDGLLALNEAHTELDVILFGSEQAMASKAQTVLDAVMDTIALHQATIAICSALCCALSVLVSVTAKTSLCCTLWFHLPTLKNIAVTSLIFAFLCWQLKFQSLLSVQKLLQLLRMCRAGLWRKFANSCVLGDLSLPTCSKASCADCTVEMCFSSNLQ